MHYSAFYRKKYRLVLPARASFWYTAAAVAERGVGFIFTPIFTRLLTAEEYGLYPLYTSFMGLFTVFITLELSGNLIYRGICKFREREGEFMRASLGIMSFSALLFGTAISISGRQMSALTGLSVSVLSFLAIQVYLNGIVNLYTARERYYYRYKSAILPNLLISVISSVLAFVITRFFGVGAPGRIYAYLVITAIIAIPLCASVMAGGIVFSKDVLRFIIKEAIPLLPHFIATGISVQAGRAIVGVFRGESELAVYSVVFSMGVVISLISGGITSSLTPWISRKLSHGAAHSTAELNNINSLIQRVTAPLCIAVLIFLCFSREALLVLAPIEYQAGLGALFPIAISVLLTFVATVQTAVMLYYGATVAVSAASVATALLNLSLNLFFTPYFGYMAAAFIQLGCSFLSVLLGALAIRVKSGTRLSYSGYINSISFTALASAVVFAMRVSFGARLLFALALILLFILKAAPLRNLIVRK